MRKCGEHAADELYMSWEDSVKRAEERYGVIIENYKAGGRRKHFDPRDEFFKMQGDLMDFFAEARKNRIEFEQKVNNIFENRQ